MITVENRRLNGGTEAHKPFFNETTVKRALESLLVYELGYGGVIEEITPTKVVVKTRIMSCIDTTIFTGSEEDMAMLVEAASISLDADIVKMVTKDKADNGIADAISTYVLKKTNGNPLLISLGSGMMLGSISIRLIMVIILQSKQYAKKLMKLKVDDLFAIFSMVIFDKQNIDDCVQLIDNFDAL